MPARMENWVRQRAERLDVGRARRALEAVVPVRAKVGGWQVQAVRLRALAERRRATGQPIEEIAHAARELLAEIKREQRYLDEQPSCLPPEVAGHSRFQDVVRAVATASSAVPSVLVVSSEAHEERSASR